MSEKWGRYVLESLLARGGMAEVFRAVATGTSGFSRTVCIKRIRPEFSQDPEFIEMFEREALIACELQHPNIVQVFDFDKHEGQYFLAMELVDGLDLRQVLKATSDMGFSLPVSFVIHVAKGLLAALRHAHERTVDGVVKPVVHRDVTPHNILVSTDGFVKLTDYGIAKARDSSFATRTGVLKGKLAYLSPEQANAEDVVPQTDLFAAGIVFWEALAGRRFVKGKTDSELLASAINPKYEELPWLSQDLNGFLKKLLMPDPKERFKSADEALSALSFFYDPRYSTSNAGNLIKKLAELEKRKAGYGIEVSDDMSPTTPKREKSRPLETDTGNSNNVSSANQKTRTSKADLSVGELKKNHLRRQRLKFLAIPAALIVVLLFAGIIAFAARGRGGDVESDSNEKVVMPSAILPVEENIEEQKEPVVELISDERDSVHEKTAVIDAGNVSGAVDVPEPHTFATSSEKTEKTNAEIGSLQVICNPWAEVFLDGRRVGTTPLSRLRLNAGSHRVLLSNSALGYKKNFNIRIKPGRLTKINEVIPN